jgi:hypothetical protein
MHSLYVHRRLSTAYRTTRVDNRNSDAIERSSISREPSADTHAPEREREREREQDEESERASIQ